MTGLQSWFDRDQYRESGGRTSEHTDYPGTTAAQGESYDPPATG